MQDFFTKWKNVINEMEGLVTAVSYDLYIETLEPIKIQDNKLIIMASTVTNKKQLLKLHRDKLLNVVRNNFENIEDIVVLDPTEKDYLTQQKDNEEKIIEEKPSYYQNKFNEKYTFENFVVGNSNKFVYAAAKRVALNPGKTMDNPLFIYGGVGLGKTHLLHSIGNYIKENDPKKNVLYVTSEQFTNDYIESLNSGKDNTQKQFREKYRNADVLMVDDIQFLANRTSTQEAFFNTFNDLYMNQKQIIITSDRHPKYIETLTDRLVSRFTGGLIQDMQQPEYETRLAILLKKVEIENYSVDSEVIEMLAENIDSSVRELEGALNKVVSLASLLGKEKATREEALEALKDISIVNHETVTIDKIIDNVCKYYNIKKNDIVGKKKSKDIVVPRQICIYLITELLDIPLITIGQAIGGRDHTTIIHARDKITSDIKTDKKLKTTIEDLKAMITSKS